MTNKQVLDTWIKQNTYMLLYSAIAFASLAICLSFYSPNDRPTQAEKGIGLFLGCVVIGKGVDLFKGGRSQ